MKIFKIIIFNIIIIFLILLICEYILYKNDNDGTPFFQMGNQYDKLSYNEKYRIFVQNEYYIDDPALFAHDKFRKPIYYKGGNKKPIILFGGSFAWGGID